MLSGGATLDGGKAYTIAGIGSRAQLHVGVFEDDVHTPPEGKANVRFLQAVVGAPSVQVTLDGQASPFGATKFGAATAYRTLVGGRYKVSLKDPAGESLLAATSVVFSPGLTYTLAAIGGGDQPVGLLPVVDQRGVATAPAGGISTGAGGTAVRAHTPRLALPLVFGVVAVFLAGGLLLRRRQRAV